MRPWIAAAWLGLVAGCAHSDPIVGAGGGSAGGSVGGGYATTTAAHGSSGKSAGAGPTSGATTGATSTGSSGSVCGNGIVEPGEECDDGNSAVGDGCSNCIVDCEPGATKNPANHHCYRVFTTAMTSPSAETACEGWGGQPGLGHLVSITDASEQAFVAGLMSGAAWIGAGDTPQTAGQWAWYDGTPFTFTHWAANEPNNPASENCIYMHADGTWDDHACGYTWPAYICERRAAGLMN